MEDYPVLRGPILEMFKQWSGLIAEFLSEQNDRSQLDTYDFFRHAREGDEQFHTILKAILNREPVASWTGDVVFKGYNFGYTRVSLQHAKFEDTTPEEDVAIRDVLEYLQVKRKGLRALGLTEAMIEGQLVDCPIPPMLPPMYAKAFRYTSPYIAAMPLEPDGSLNLDPLYTDFQATPGITFFHLNCLARILMRKNVCQRSDSGSAQYTLGFTAQVIQRVIAFLQLPEEWHGWAKNEIAYGRAIAGPQFQNPVPDYFPHLLAFHVPIAGVSPIDAFDVLDLFNLYVRNFGAYVSPTKDASRLYTPGAPVKYVHSSDGNLVLKYRKPLEPFVTFFMKHGLPPEDLSEFLLPISHETMTPQFRQKVKRAIKADVQKIVARLGSGATPALGGRRRKIERSRRRK